MQGEIKLWTEKFCEAWASCMFCMVQGDLTVLTFNHAMVASKTGALAGLAMVVASFVPWDNRWLGVFLTGAFTALADSVIHAEGFPLEHLATGLGAMLLCVLLERGKYGNRYRRSD